MTLFPVTREPDEIDAILAHMAYKMNHERRMKQIREMDIEQWVAEQS